MNHVYILCSVSTTTTTTTKKQQLRTYRIVDFAVPADHKVKLKEREKKDENLELAREQKKLQNMKVTV